MIDTRKKERLSSLIERLVAEYIARESDTRTLLTVTRTTLSDDRKYATIFFTSFPEKGEGDALAFFKRQARTIQHYIEEHARVGHVPYLSFVVDEGEKNRQKIDRLSIESRKNN